MFPLCQLTGTRRCATASLQFLIDNLCANFTQRSIYGLLEALLAERPRTMSDIALAIADKDRSLDMGSAQVLAKAAVEALAESGVIAVEDAYIRRAV